MVKQSRWMTPDAFAAVVIAITALLSRLFTHPIGRCLTTLGCCYGRKSYARNSFW